MNIIVCMKETVDPALDLEAGFRNGVVFGEGLPLVLNPADAEALSLALDLRSLFGEVPVEITIVSLGPERVESYLRNGLALGADRAVRIPAESTGPLSPYQKARLLSGAASLFSADLVLTGSVSLDNGSGLVGPLLAAGLDCPCVIDVTGIEPEEDSPAVIVTRDIGRGRRQKLRCGLPAVLAVKGEGRLPYASLDRLMDAAAAEITLLTPADLGVTPVHLDFSPVRVTGLSQPRPRPRKVTTPDSSLPAFYRILELLKGGISGRQGLMLEGTTDEIAGRLYDILLEEGVIRPAES